MERKIVYIISMAVALMLLCSLSYPAFGYEAKGKRDPFVPLVGQERVSRSSGLEGIVSAQDIVLEGIAIGSSGNNIAILNGQMVKEKDKIGLIRIRKISKKAVELSVDGKIHTLSLQEEEGIKVGK